MKKNGQSEISNHSKAQKMLNFAKHEEIFESIVCKCDSSSPLDSKSDTDVKSKQPINLSWKFANTLLVSVLANLTARGKNAQGTKSINDLDG